MEITKESIKAAIADKVVYELSCENEDTSVRGNFASGNDAQDKEMEDAIIADLESLPSGASAGASAK